MRRRRLQTWWRRLREVQQQTLTCSALWMKLGPAKALAGEAWTLVDIAQPPAETGKRRAHVTFEFALNKPRRRERRRRAGRYLLRTHLTGSDPATLWQHYMTLCPIEEAFRNLQGELSLRYRISTPSSCGSRAKLRDYRSSALCLPARQSGIAARVASITPPSTSAATWLRGWAAVLSNSA